MSDADAAVAAPRAWRFTGSEPQASLGEVNATVSVPKGGVWFRRLLAFVGPGLHGLGRLHGPGQLGDRPRRRGAVRLHAAGRHPAFQPHGDPVAGACRAPRHRHRPRPRAGLPRPLSADRQLRAVDRLRTRHHRHRSGGGDRHRDRAAASVRHPADLGRADHRARRVPAASADEPGLPLPRGVRHRASERDRDLLPGADRGRRAAGCGGARRFPAEDRDRHQPDDALHRHRHHRRHGDAAQSLPAFLDRADARLRAQRGGAGATRSSGRRPIPPSR